MRCGLDLCIPEELVDHRQPLARGQCRRGEGVTEVVDANVRHLAKVSRLSSGSGGVQAIQDQVSEAGLVLPVRSGDVERYQRPSIYAMRCRGYGGDAVLQ